MALLHTPISEIDEIYATLNQTFRKGTTRPLSYRRNQLYQLAQMVQDHAKEFADSIFKDVGKPTQEAFMAEVSPAVQKSLESASSLEEWSKPLKPEVPDWQKPWQPTVHKVPVGPVLVIAPWNYPMILSLQPLIAAISAGCPAVVKPSEIAPAYSQLLAELVPKYLDPAAYRVVNGAVEEATKLLSLRWGHIFYTGNGRVGRVIASAAAKNLVPCSLELGGKSPVAIAPDFDHALAAKRILWGKVTNAGQTCVAPDYVLVTKDKQQELIDGFRTHYKAFYPEGSALKSKSYGRIVSPLHHKRLRELYASTKGSTVVGGTVEEPLAFEPTIVADVKEDDPLMADEIFGPILPIVAVSSVDDMIAFTNARDHALTYYVFTNDETIKSRFLSETLSGSLHFNDTFQQLAADALPFGGVGESGYGPQHLKYGFDAFTHLRGMIDMPVQAEPHLGVRYPPYTDESLQFMSLASQLPIPKREVVNGKQ